MELETVKGCTGSICSFGSSNPAVQAFLSASFLTESLGIQPLSVTSANSVEMQAGGGIAQNGSGIGK